MTPEFQFEHLNNYLKNPYIHLVVTESGKLVLMGVKVKVYITLCDLKGSKV